MTWERLRGSSTWQGWGLSSDPQNPHKILGRLSSLLIIIASKAETVAPQNKVARLSISIWGAVGDLASKNKLEEYARLFLAPTLGLHMQSQTIVLELIFMSAFLFIFSYLLNFCDFLLFSCPPFDWPNSLRAWHLHILFLISDSWSSLT